MKPRPPNEIDEMLDSSSNEEEFIDRLYDGAKKKYGQKAVDKFANDLPKNITKDEFSKKAIAFYHNGEKENYEKKDLIKWGGGYTTNLEDIYSGLDSLKYLSKLGAPTSILTESLRAIPKGIAKLRGTSQTEEVAPFKEFTSIEPQGRVGLSPLVADIVNATYGKTEPLIEKQSSHFPKAFELVRQLSDPKVGLGAVVDSVATPTSLAKVKNLPKYSKSTVKSFLNSIKTNNSLFEELSDSGSINRIKNLVHQKPDKYMRFMKPEKILDELLGEVDELTNRRKVGNIQKVNDERNRIVDAADNGEIISDTENLYNSVKDKIGKNPDRKLKTQIDAENKLLNENIIVERPSQKIWDNINENIINENELLNQEHALNYETRLKRAEITENSEILKEILNDEIDLNESALSKKNITTHEQLNQLADKDTYIQAIDDLESTARVEIANVLDGPTTIANNEKLLGLKSSVEKLRQYKKLATNNFNDFKTYIDSFNGANDKTAKYFSDKTKQANELMSLPKMGESITDLTARNSFGRALKQASSDVLGDLIEQSNPGESLRFKNLGSHESDLINLRNLVAGRVGGGRSTDIRVPQPNAFSVAREAGKVLNEKIKPIVNRTGTALVNSQMRMNRGDLGRRFNMINDASRITNEKTINFKIPRTSKEAFENSDEIAKIINNSRIPPEIVDRFYQIRTNSEMNNFLLLLNGYFPDKFKKTKYRAFNGIIYDPEIKRKALSDLRDNKNLSAAEKAKKIERLINNAEIDDEDEI